MLAATSLIAKELESPCCLKISFSSSTSVRGTGMTYQQKTYTLLSTYFPCVVRMAERSNAPDSRLITFPSAHWERAFWSPTGGVGSNPTPDTRFMIFFFQCVICIFIYCLSQPRKSQNLYRIIRQSEFIKELE